jgi:uncharacterized tellurite resistance protein B-like protein
MKIDKRITTEEIQYIRTCIDQANIDESDKTGLLQMLESTDKMPITYNAFVGNPEEALGLIIDLTALARIDGTIHLSEKLYIKQVSALLGFSEGDIDEMLSSS